MEDEKTNLRELLSRAEALEDALVGRGMKIAALEAELDGCRRRLVQGVRMASELVAHCRRKGVSIPDEAASYVSSYAAEAARESLSR